MDALLDPTIKKIAIADPKHDPYGQAAVSAMKHFKVYDRVQDKLVLRKNALDAARFASSGNADVGIIALSLALAPVEQSLGRSWLIPQESHPTIEYSAVIIKTSTNQDGAKKFLDLLQAPRSKAVMKQYGLILSAEDVSGR